MPTWTVEVKESVIEDLRALGRKEGRAVWKLAAERLAADPLVETRNLKILRPNPFAERELRLLGKYRVLFGVEPGARKVVIVVVGEKRGASVFVRGRRFSEHESHSAK